MKVPSLTNKFPTVTVSPQKAESSPVLERYMKEVKIVDQSIAQTQTEVDQNKVSTMRTDVNEAVVIDASGAVLLMNPYQQDNINDSVNNSLNNSGENNMKQDNSKQNLNPKYSSV